MMRRRSGGNRSSGPGPIGAAARSLLALAFGLAVALSPLAMISCPHHGAPSADAGADSGHSQTAMAAPHGESGHSGSHDHDHGAGPCCCLGQCCPGSSSAHPGAFVSDVWQHGAVVAIAPATNEAVRLPTGRWLLPWPNGPPALS